MRLDEMRQDGMRQDRPGFARDLRRGEEAAVDRLLSRAFGGEDEVRLVHRLRRDGAMAGEVVLPCGDGIAGYYALSKMRAPKGWLCLAPVAIDPDWQGQRHGQRMIGMLAEWARLSRVHVVVLGQVGFYERGGFRQDRAAHLTSPYPIAHTLLAGPGDDAPAEKLLYPQAFEALE